MATTTDGSENSEKNASEQAATAEPISILYSPESEKLLISTILNESRKELAHGLLVKIAAKDFHIEEHAAIWRAATELNDNRVPCDATSLIDHARGTRTFIGGSEYIFGLAEDPIAAVASADSIKNASKRVKELSVLRSLKEILSVGMNLCDKAGNNNYEQVLSLIEDDLLNLRKTSESSRAGPTHIRSSLDGLMERLEKQMEGEQIGVGITTGHADIDEITSGLIDEDFIILAARPSMGKTAACLNLAANGAKAGQAALIFSLEMRDTALAQRLLGREGRVPLNNLRTAKLEEGDLWSRLSEGVHRLGELPIYIDDTPGLTINEIRSRARTFVAEHGKCTMYVDYIQKIGMRDSKSGGGKIDMRTHVSECSAGLKGIARELKIPVVGLAQLNRGVEQRANKRPMMSDLAESGSLEQDADLIAFLYRDEYYNPDTEDKGVTEFIIAKQRDGAVGTVKLFFQNEIGLFSDYTGYQ
jgi:replicative DNA helicase